VKAFTQLYNVLDNTTKTNQKIIEIISYFKKVSYADAAWAIFFLTGRKPKSLIQMPRLVSWAIEICQIPEWLFAESYDVVGDLAETIAKLLPESSSKNNHSLSFLVEQRLLPLKNLDETDQRN
jgi:DNA ligase-1